MRAKVIFADGQTDMAKVIGRLRDYSKEPRTTADKEYPQCPRMWNQYCCEKCLHNVSHWHSVTL